MVNVFNERESVAQSIACHSGKVAIVGMGCRFPGGADDIAAFWQLLCEGRDAIVPVPSDRWDRDALYHPDFARLGKIHSRYGGFIDHVRDFDAGFFGMSPREAQHADPQHRLLAEVAVQACETAGIPVTQLSNRAVGVFVGISTRDYGEIRAAATERLNVSAHTNQGTSPAVAANRLSYLFNLKGPSLAVDTACSSSIYALHYALASIAAGDCDMAFVGGVNAILKPEGSIGFSKGGFLSKRGRCHAFDSRADGYVRGEGAGLVLLKPLNDAIRDGNRVFAVVRGSAVNEDGRTEGLSLPSAEAQQAMLERAYRRASVLPHEVSYVEAHGTGTAAGDPIEAKAIGSVLSPARNGDEPCLIGSVKTNIGHLEAASGIAGLIKLVLALHHDFIPASLHYESPNPNIDFDQLKLRVVRKGQSWPRTGRKIAGINSFGFGGANAHAVLEGAPVIDINRSQQARDPATLVCLTAKSREALLELASRYEESSSAEPVQDVGWSSVHTRDHHSHRVAVATRGTAELRKLLGEWRAGESATAVAEGKAERLAEGRALSPVFVFSGQGPQWHAMGLGLYQEDSIYRKTLDRIDALFAPLSGWSILGELRRGEAATRMDETHIAQPCLFALQVGLAERWKRHGIMPRAVIGHSVGEVAAAVIAGVLTLEEGVRVIYHRSRVQHKATDAGIMVAIGVDRARAQSLIAACSKRVSIAAINGPTSVVLAGDREPLEAIAAKCAADGIFQRRLEVRVPFHSHHMEPLRAELIDALADVQGRQGHLPFYSTVTGKMLSGTSIDPSYWFRNVRDPVEFAAGIEQLIADGYDAFIELSPHPILSAGVEALLADANKPVRVTHSLRRHQDEPITFLAGVARCWTWGHEIDATSNGVRVDLPHYPFQRQTHWLETDVTRELRLGRRIHPYVARHTEVGPKDHHFEILLDWHAEPYLEHHRLHGTIVFPGAGHLETVLACARHAFDDDFIVENVTLELALFLPEEGAPPDVRLTISGDSGRFYIQSRPVGAEEWTTHVHGWVNHRSERFEELPFDIEAIRARCTSGMEIPVFYKHIFDSGLELGQTFRNITRLELAKGDGDCLAEALARVEVPDTLQAGVEKFNLHPAILDACFQAYQGALFAHLGSTDTGIYIPVAMRQVRLFAKPGPVLHAYIKLTRAGKRTIESDLVIVNANGERVAELHGCQGHYVEGSRRGRPLAEKAYRPVWVPRDRGDQKVARDAAGLLSPPSVVDREMQAFVSQVAADPISKQYYREFEPEMERLCVSYITEALARLDIQFCDGARIDAHPKPISGRFARLMNHLFGELAARGFLRKDGNAWRVSRTPQWTAASLQERLVRDFPEFHDELALIEQCGTALSSVLSGQVDATHVLFSSENWNLLSHFYAEANSNNKYNRMAAKSIEALIKEMPADRTLRILEIGGGTGGTTKYVLDVLPARRTEYLFTDVSSAFVPRAQERFAGRPFLEVGTLDLERDPRDQGFEPESFDLIVASNVLHATRSLHDTLARVRNLLAPEGALVVLEITQPPLWLYLVFGLTDGWWSFEDGALRPDRATLKSEQWVSLLTGCGFGSAHAYSDVADPEATAQHVIIARADHRSTLAQAPVREAPEQKQLLLLAETTDVENVARGFEANGWKVVVEKPTIGREQLTTLLRAATHVVHTAAWDAPGDSLRDLYSSVFQPLIDLVGAAASVASPPRLVIATRSAQAPSLDSGAPSISGGAVWGMGRVLINEYTQLDLRLIDLPRKLDGKTITSFVRECESAVVDGDVVLHGDRRWAYRVEQDPTFGGTARSRLQLPSAQAFDARIGTPGLLDSIVFAVSDRRPLGEHDVEVDVRASALNFRDLMLAMGLYSEEMGRDGIFASELGMECAGVVRRVGSRVTAFRVGDEVLGVCRSAFTNVVVTRDSYLVRKPACVSFEDAAALPVAMSTAIFCLENLARIQPGERVLIHSGAGGVGLAAIQYARWKGAVVFASAGNDERRRFLREQMGVQHVMDSRGLNFTQYVKDHTGGKGVDVVLNSLKGDAMARSVACLARYGRFVEIGKTDIYSDASIGLRPFKENLSFFAFDLDKLAADKPEVVPSVFQTFVDLIESEGLQPLPHKAFHISKIHDAFRFMSQSRHIGKVVLTVDDTRPIPVVHPPEKREIIDPKKHYVVTGGTSGLGLFLGRWLAGKGAKHITLIGRSGIERQEVRTVADELKSLGCQVDVRSLDVGDYAAVAELVRELRASQRPIGGIFHSAMVLDDVLSGSMTEERFWRVLSPKAEGALNLHRVLLEQDVHPDHVVFFSSISNIFGNPGQSSYNAANHVLESLALARRASGQRACVVNLGVLSGVGFVARNKDVSGLLEGQGWSLISASEVASLLEQTLIDGAAHRVLCDANWSVVERFAPSVAAKSRFEWLVQSSADGKSRDGKTEIADQVAQLEDAEKPLAVAGHLQGELARILGAKRDALALDEPISHLGMDSLMANQLRNWIQANFAVEIPMMKVMQGPTLLDLAGMVLQASDRPATSRAQGAAQKSANPWVRTPVPRADPKLRLFCFPYLGGGASAFAGWAAELPENIELCAIQLPGHEERERETGHDDIHALVRNLSEAILPLLDRPFAFYGHSVGSLLAFNVASYIETHHDRSPEQLFVAAWRAPHAYDASEAERRERAKVGDEESFRDFVEHVLGMSQVTDDAVESARRMKPVLDRELDMIARYRHRGETVRTGITLLTGTHDRVYPRELMDRWRELTSGSYAHGEIHGGHIFMNTAVRETVDTVVRGLRGFDEVRTGN